jgi:hypothetical protein
MTCSLQQGQSEVPKVLFIAKMAPEAPPKPFDASLAFSASALSASILARNARRSLILFFIIKLKIKLFSIFIINQYLKILKHFLALKAQVGF